MKQTVNAFCRIDGKELIPIVDFGQQPIANGFMSQVDEEEFFYHMIVGFCPTSYMVQLIHTVPPEAMFNENYAFISSTSSAMARHFENNAREIMDKLEGKNDPFVIELGCNDGIMLKHIAEAGIRQLGVEPSGNVAELARKNGVVTTERFFNKETAQEILEENGPADVICGSNVFCHIEDINSVFAGMSVLLRDDGYVYFEDPYLWDIIQKSSFDQIYDEHVYYYSGLSVEQLAKKHGLQLVAMAHQEVHGGSMRYYLKKGEGHSIDPSVEEWINKEKALKLDKVEGYKNFRDSVNQICTDLKALLENLKDEGKRIVAYGATSKSTTLLNYAQIGPDIIEYICDTTPTKINKFSPGMHIPVVSYERFQNDDVLHTLLLAWNHKKEIVAKEEAYRKKGGKFITYFPQVVME